METATNLQLKEQYTDFYGQGIEKFIPWHDKHLRHHRDSTKKQPVIQQYIIQIKDSKNHVKHIYHVNLLSD